MSSDGHCFDLHQLDSMPGHGIRRLQQIAVSLFMQETEAFMGLTPVQFAVLQALQQQEGLDQKSLAERVAFDTSTIGAVLDRLEGRQLLTRSSSPHDRRVRIVHLTEQGRQLLESALPAVQRTQQRILEPLDAQEQAQFCALLKKLCAQRQSGG